LLGWRCGLISMEGRAAINQEEAAWISIWATVAAGIKFAHLQHLAQFNKDSNNNNSLNIDQQAKAFLQPVLWRIDGAGTNPENEKVDVAKKVVEAEAAQTYYSFFKMIVDECDKNYDDSSAPGYVDPSVTPRPAWLVNFKNKASAPTTKERIKLVMTGRLNYQEEQNRDGEPEVGSLYKVKPSSLSGIVEKNPTNNPMVQYHIQTVKDLKASFAGLDNNSDHPMEAYLQDIINLYELCNRITSSPAQPPVNTGNN